MTPYIMTYILSQEKIYILSYFSEPRFSERSYVDSPFNTSSNKKWEKQPPVVFCKKKVLLEILLNSQENTCRPATLLKKRLWRRCFLPNFAKFLRAPFLQNTSGRVLLKWIPMRPNSRMCPLKPNTERTTRLPAVDFSSTYDNFPLMNHLEKAF